ncbi:hypothetical protein D3C74_435070 [compost metagenome]
MEQYSFHIGYKPPFQSCLILAALLPLLKYFAVPNKKRGLFFHAATGAGTTAHNAQLSALPKLRLPSLQQEKSGSSAVSDIQSHHMLAAGNHRDTRITVGGESWFQLL